MRVDIQKEFSTLEKSLLESREDIITEVTKEILKTESNLESQILKYEIIEALDLKTHIISVVEKFYQKLINLNRMIQKNLVFNIKNKPKDLMFLHKKAYLAFQNLQ